MMPCDLGRYLLAQAVRSDNRAIIENKSKFVLVHSTSGQKDALNEVLQDPSIAGRVADTKVGAATFGSNLPDKHRAEPD